MRVYISGPMRGLPGLNRAAFNRAAEQLRARGHDVYNPAEEDTSDDIRINLANDLEYVTLNADTVVLLPGWAKSLGAKAEVCVAWAIPLPVVTLSDFLATGTDGARIEVRYA